MENIETFGCKKRLCFATSTRADWGLLSPVARAVRELPDVEVLVMATNMHLMAEYGHSADEILADGFSIDAAVPMEVRGEGEAARVRAMAECMSGTADALERLAPMRSWCLATATRCSPWRRQQQSCVCR